MMMMRSSSVSHIGGMFAFQRIGGRANTVASGVVGGCGDAMPNVGVQHSSKRTLQGTSSDNFASAKEIGKQLHFSAVRRLNLLHKGEKENGWIIFYGRWFT